MSAAPERRFEVYRVDDFVALGGPGRDPFVHRDLYALAMHESATHEHDTLLSTQSDRRFCAATN